MSHSREQVIHPERPTAPPDRGSPMADDSARTTSQAQITATLSRCPLFRGLPADALAALSAQVTPFPMPIGTMLWHQGDEPVDLVVVQSGLLCESQPSRSGRRSVLHLKGP